MYICIQKLSLEIEVDQMLNDMMQKEGWTRSYALSVLRSKFESEERNQEVSYVDDLIQKEAEQEKQESELTPKATTITTTREVEKIPITTNESKVTTRKPSKVTPPTTTQRQKEKELQGTISNQLDKQTILINKKIIQILQPIQKQSQSI